MAQKHVFIICGEPSGDLHAANLVKAISEINPEIKFSGVGGQNLASTGAEIIYDIKGLACIGLFDVLKKLPEFFKLQRLILEKITSLKPQAIILVDFSGFNLRLAKKINRRIPVLYYVSPQVWASRPGRLKTIKKYIHKMLVLFKFEREFYKRHGIEAEFVGHPLLDIVKPAMDKAALLDNLRFSESNKTIALLPGSRRQEIENILPVMLKASCIIAKYMPNTQFVIAKSPQVDWQVYQKDYSEAIPDIAIEWRKRIKIVEGKTYDCLNIADFCLVASGTATLECAIMQKPLCVIYKMGLLNYLLYRPQIKVPYIGMVNIVAQEMIAPEFIQFNARAKRIAKEALRILENPSEIERIKNKLKQIKSSLGEPGACLRAARIILNFLHL